MALLTEADCCDSFDLDSGESIVLLAEEKSSFAAPIFDDGSRTGDKETKPEVMFKSLRLDERSSEAVPVAE